jgi:hypothetical protein
MSKYKFVETQGCTAFSFTINDQEIGDIPKEKLKEIINYLCEKMKEGIDDGTVHFPDIVRSFQTSDWGSDKERCDQCGDTVSWEIWEI